ncbi:MAG TPA: glycoside hydrolase family 19 protein [Pyrinomonadaceae bacterium]|nr:glycoside hydrolase family 19 protein [Pyrinomonadaceae bacterium]
MNNEITDAMLRDIMPNLPAAKRQLYLPYLNAAMREFQIATYLRASAFIAQLAHESAELRYFEEIASGKAYEGRKDLGNTQPGDGVKYKGHGPIQITGRANHAACGKALGLDLINNPTLITQPPNAFRSAGWFWDTRGLNALADQRLFKAITKKINGGFNGLADRQKYYDRALRIIPEDLSLGAADLNVPPDEKHGDVNPAITASTTTATLQSTTTTTTTTITAPEEALAAAGASLEAGDDGDSATASGSASLPSGTPGS